MTSPSWDRDNSPGPDPLLPPNPAVLRIVDQMLAHQATGDNAARTKARKQLEQRLSDVDAGVAVFGAINLRTDGRRGPDREAISSGQKRDLYTFEPGPDGKPAGYQQVTEPEVTSGRNSPVGRFSQITNKCSLLSSIDWYGTLSRLYWVE
jgi:hypothetical protein